MYSRHEPLPPKILNQINCNVMQFITSLVDEKYVPDDFPFEKSAQCKCDYREVMCVGLSLLSHNRKHCSFLIERAHE